MRMAVNLQSNLGNQVPNDAWKGCRAATVRGWALKDHLATTGVQRGEEERSSGEKVVMGESDPLMEDELQRTLVGRTMESVEVQVIEEAI